MKIFYSFLIIFLFTPSLFADSTEINNDSDTKRVFFVEPVDGAHVHSPITIKMGVSGMQVAKAGELVDGAGHHHLIINGSAIEKDMVVPADKDHIHFGGGQTETTLELEPGEYSLTLQFADGIHRSYGEEMSKTIHIKVE